jgi:hypothetical protein
MISKYHIDVLTAYENITKGETMITIRDIYAPEADRLMRVLGEANFCAVPTASDANIYDKISCNDKVSVAFSPRHGYAILESDLGQFELQTGDFSTITIL